MFELTEKAKVHSYKTTWDSYLHSLKENKSAERVIGMVITYLLSHLHGEHYSDEAFDPVHIFLCTRSFAFPLTKAVLMNGLESFGAPS
jgi:hypothetical protein